MSGSTLQIVKTTGKIMPECQAKFCTVRRGQGFNTFSIPDPKHDYDLCKRWIHNLGNKKLNIKTFVFAYHKIVCEKHFEEDCFEDDVEVRIYFKFF